MQKYQQMIPRCLTGGKMTIKQPPLVMKIYNGMVRFQFDSRYCESHLATYFLADYGGNIRDDVSTQLSKNIYKGPFF